MCSKCEQAGLCLILTGVGAAGQNPKRLEPNRSLTNVVGPEWPGENLQNVYEVINQLTANVEAVMLLTLIW